MSQLGLEFFAEGVVAGVDEVGRGPLAGPVVAAAVILGADGQAIEGLADSKRLGAGRRSELSELIRERAVAWAVTRVEADEIDRINILQASLLAMRRAVLELVPAPARVQVDGNRLPSLPMPGEAIVGGDGSVPAISAASILAKVMRDAWMDEIDREYPEYGFASHKGYPTPEHLKRLAAYGPCPIHRRSFAPVRRCLRPAVE
jgi:ribonuclease HII